MSPQRRLARDVEQVGRIIRRTDAGGEYQVVACTFSFVSKSAAGDPEERVEPIDRPEHACRERDDPVATKDVRQLVVKHRMHAILGPGLGAFRQENRRPHDPPRCQQRWMPTSQKTDVLTNAVTRGDLICDCAPHSRRDGFRLRGKRSKSQQPDAEHSESDRARLRSRSPPSGHRGTATSFVLTSSVAVAGAAAAACGAGALLDSRSDDVADDVSQATGSGIDHEGSSSSTAGTHRQHTIVVASTQCRIAAERLRSMTVNASAASVRRAILSVTLSRRVIATRPFVPSVRVRRSVLSR